MKTPNFSSARNEAGNKRVIKTKGHLSGGAMKGAGGEVPITLYVKKCHGVKL